MKGDKEMKLHRLQSEKYNIDENSRSFVWGYENWYEAALEDLKEHNLTDIEQVDGNEKDIERIWIEAHENEGFPGWYRTKAENGISCFQTLEELYRYFFTDEGRSEMDFYCDRYVLIFEGTPQYYGLDDEIIARYEKEVDRMTVEEMVRRCEQ
ncbi:MAG TPA: hypothetical protein PLS45_09295 [Bacillota bacterium]|nr:hypothetical protein [Bacillota bacterium]